MAVTTAPEAALPLLAEREVKRSRYMPASSADDAESAEPLSATKAHLGAKFRAEYKDAVVLPPAVQAQQGGGVAAGALKGKPTPTSSVLAELEEAYGVAQRQDAASTSTSTSATSQALTLPVGGLAAARGAAASQLQSALMVRGDAMEDTGRSMLNSALQRKKERAAQQAQPAYHAPWKLMRVISGHLGWVRCVAVDPHNQWFATGAGDRMIKIWDMASGELKLTLTGHISTVRGLAVSGRHPYMFSAGEDKLVKCWDLETNKVVRQYYGHLSGIYSLSLHPTLDVVVTAGRDASARVWDIRTKTQVHVLGGHRGTVASVQCQDSDPQVLTGSMDATVKLWDLAAGKCMTTLTHHKKSVRALAVAPHEFTFVSGSAGGRNVKKWRCPEGTLLANMTHDGIVNTLSVNADGVLFSGADDGSMKVRSATHAVPRLRDRPALPGGAGHCAARLAGRRGGAVLLVV